MPVLQRVSVSVKNILLATDFSSVSEKAACYAKALALNFRSAVEVAHVFEPSLVLSSLEAALGKPVQHRRRDCAQGLERLAEVFGSPGHLEFWHADDDFRFRELALPLAEPFF